MAPFLILAGSVLGFRAFAMAGVSPLASWQADARFGLALMLLVTAAAHFNATRPDLIRMVPAGLPWPAQIVAVTGGLELLAAAGLVIPFTAPLAGIVLAALLVAMFPANVNASLRQLHLRGKRATPFALRLPIQLVFIGLALWATQAAALSVAV